MGIVALAVRGCSRADGKRIVAPASCRLSDRQPGPGVPICEKSVTIFLFASPLQNLAQSRGAKSLPVAAYSH